MSSSNVPDLNLYRLAEQELDSTLRLILSNQMEVEFFGCIEPAACLRLFSRLRRTLALQSIGSTMSATGPGFLHNEKAEQAALSDFSNLSNGDTVIFYLANEKSDRIEWLHDHVERDLIFGTARLGSGRTLPVDCYLENTGFGLLFDTSNSKASKEGLVEDVSGTVFLSAPLPSQLLTRWKPSEKGPRYASFAGREKKAVEAFVEDLKSKGFSEGPSWRSSGFNIRLPIWETSWQKQGCNVGLTLDREPQGLLNPTRFLVSVTDYSHRPIWKRGTRLLTKDGLSLTEALDAITTGIDIAWSKSR